MCILLVCAISAGSYITFYESFDWFNIANEKSYKIYTPTLLYVAELICLLICLYVLRYPNFPQKYKF